MPESLHISHNKIKKLHCPRAYQHSYPMNLERDTPKTALVIGNAFHRGMESALRYSLYAEEGYKDTGYIIQATAAAHDYIDEQSDQFTEFDKESPDDMKATLSAMFNTYIPIIGINRNWRVALHGEVFTVCAKCEGEGTSPILFGETPNNHNVVKMPCLSCTDGKSSDKTPMIEFHFDEHIQDGIYAKGFVDAVLQNLHTGEYTVIDWKTATGLRTLNDVALDGQLAVYTAVLQRMGANITAMAMWEFTKETPKMPVVNKNNKPSIQARKTTWDVWYNNLPPLTKEIVDADLHTWKTWAEEKLHTMDSFSNYIEDFLDVEAGERALENLVEQGKLIRLLETANLYPAINNAGYGGQCKTCEFATLCAGVYRYGDSPDRVISEQYRQKTRN